MTHFIKINEAYARIREAGLDRFRCYLTGAPYATIDESEVRIALDSMVRDEPTVTVDNLVDSWELKALTFNSQVLPSLRGSNPSALFSNALHGHTGQTRILTYMLTRLLFPDLTDRTFDTEKKRSRMLFAITLHDKVIAYEDHARIADLVARLTAIDAFCSMPYWHTMWAFESQLSQYGLAKAPKHVQAFFADPHLLLDGDVTRRVDAILEWMFPLMLYVTERDGVAGRSGSKMAQRIMLVQVANVPVTHVPHFQKEVSKTDYVRIAHQRAMNTNNAVKIAYSAIHGSGKLAVSNKPTTTLSDLARKAAKKAVAGDVKAKAKTPTKGKTDSTFNSRLASAFASFMKKD
ncbi:hypothetical protein Bpfe_031122 [Biomphalaria pfeifferi]|uniref:Uncharacterized protein n=1 Tax=Biomphalaria pfeifferi TaxID=112525 RepID=A0AAD8ANG5_BIOPF|nr:hypothetical protein Bpfe_031122 [Biomphalaria pfeifferi]